MRITPKLGSGGLNALKALKDRYKEVLANETRDRSADVEPL